MKPETNNVLDENGTFVQQFPYLVAQLYVWVEGPLNPECEAALRACIPSGFFESAEDTDTGRRLEFLDMSPQEAAEAVEKLATVAKDEGHRIECIRVEVDRYGPNYEGTPFYSYEVELK